MIYDSALSPDYSVNTRTATSSTEVCRDHAIVEQVFVGLFDGPLAHLPSRGVRRRRLGDSARDRQYPDARRRLPGLGVSAGPAAPRCADS